jgi:hypothetical protein
MIAIPINYFQWTPCYWSRVVIREKGTDTSFLPDPKVPSHWGIVLQRWQSQYFKSKPQRANIFDFVSKVYSTLRQTSYTVSNFYNLNKMGSGGFGDRGGRT